MVVHDWTKVDSGVWHHFHLGWLGQLSIPLNRGLLPKAYYAMAEQRATIYEPDLLTLERVTSDTDFEDRGGVAILERPKVQLVQESKNTFYTRRRRVIAIRHVSDDRLVAVVELVSPGNKSSNTAIKQFVDKSLDFIERGNHVTLIDLFPGSKRNPGGFHGLIWDSISGEEYRLPTDKPLLLSSYEVAGDSVRAYLEPLKVGDVLPDMPLYLREHFYVMLPLAETYEQAWRGMPKHLTEVLARSL